MISKIIQYLKCLIFGCEESKDAKWLKDKLEKQEKKLEEIEDENLSIDDINDHFNNQ